MVSDIHCLKSIKKSLEDPLNMLSSWSNFDNKTEGFICKFRGVDCWNPAENKVLRISLPGMGLIGEFPRGIQGCSDLTSLDLSNNNLYGTIPFDISKLIGYVVNLDLSSNQFSGAIPGDIANCPFLNALKLDNNNLEGLIPPEIGSLRRLKKFSVANNMLTGQVPIFTYRTFSVETYANNSGLCGGPLEPCVLGHGRVLFVCGLVTGWALSTLLGIYLCFFGLLVVKKMLLLIKKRTKAMEIDGNQWPEEVNNDPKILKLEKFVTRMSFMELSKATSNFSLENEIGKGMLGKVYKALVPNGWTVAIKRLQCTEDLEEEFVSEITTLGSLRHPNLVSLIGFCSERDERLLVYKYMPNGNLHEWLHSTEDKARLLDFPLRVKIAVGVARALSWLHHVHVVHSNISTQCVLLDENLDPKLSNFWEATLTEPNDIDSLDFTTYKKDVYRFGVVLLELLTRKESYQLSYLSLNLSTSSFASPLDVDELLLGQGFDDMVMQLLELASNCMKFIPDQRPTMQQVYQTVAAIARIHDQTGDSEIQLHMD
ncbi:hypothetical protein HAX54_032128 [Datura stramonium]|uniref:non-specific serine/threonine protein kinase n=1 Tax=Datura stramonium TaxID=4076 RepID=A0ABS8SCE0_DATST|nr:hypothetical protein [Datura stramonium]